MSSHQAIRSNDARTARSVSKRNLHLPDWLTVSLAVLYFAVFKIVCVPQIVQQALKVCCVYFVLLYIVTNLKGDDYKRAVIPFCIMVIVSTQAGYLNGYVDFSNYADSIFYAICLYALALLIAACANRGRIATVINVFFWMTVVYCILSAAFIIEVGTADGLLLYYFAGNKFSTSYYFVMLACLTYVKLEAGGSSRKVTIMATAALGLLALLVAIHLYCSTAAVMAVLVVMLALMPRRFQQVLTKPSVVVGAMLLTGIVLPFLTQVLQIPIVQHVVVDILGENLSLSGRDLIYSSLSAVIGESPVLGYGYGNAAVAMYVGYGNAQNSIMETVVNYGLIGLCAILYMAWVSARGRKPSWAWGAYALLYAMILGSVVEITYNYFFFIALMVVDISSNVVDRDVSLRSAGISGRVQ